MRKKCLDMVHELARRDGRVVFIGSDLGFKTLDAFREELPDQFFIEGISEQNVVGMAAGMALEGRIPYVNTIATFIVRRALEQVAMDLCLHDLPVRLIGNGGGLVYAPLGSTHLAVEDIALMRALPNMTVVCPADAEEMERFMDVSVDWPHPIYIRLAKGYDPVVTDPSVPFVIGRGQMYRQGGDVLLATTGIGLRVCLEAAEILDRQGVNASVLHLPTVKPLDTELLLRAVGGVRAVVCVEEHTVIGGLGSAIGETMLEAGLFRPFRRVGVPDVFPDHYGTQELIMERYGIWPEPVAETALDLLKGGA
ncbi:MAG: transketolase [Pseudodesulfovibrio sp.]|uniref:Transketolase domain-containing protein n=1 Tax=Pseudodesulfovibrio aespoeensis (strain ATCC 700646 / DSM 10631 / Aspo-2) TaxID=643562 RepID=E6VR01_PSEA9|nr:MULTISPECIES: transketolase C-terminal domain-containing protein [Pseudodesulfovibrio]MBU4380238.1 transketolase [Pseudomonadota bacterium]ADU62981.1 Transketolase domain-containing protein [Pseudodesulfovibrio aespoeensis Aspo-2]MBU4475915.1 transketolase [Pseudomonadota bacterium]MBU4516753.1 transketolase [Pseudomonadota bacterium]MBU4522710.1 transketolase [Pseudomonadota bacterium]